MMIISFSPRAASPGTEPEAPELAVKGDVLTINGEDFDFGPLNEGDRLMNADIESSYFSPIGYVTRTDGAICVELLLAHGFIPYPAPEESRCVTFPAPIVVKKDGRVKVPFWKHVPNEATQALKV